MDNILHEIHDFNRQVELDQYTCSRHACPHCASPTEARCARHQTVPRMFLVPIRDAIRSVESWRVRFRCLACGKTFTDYPPFALPHKRFVKQVVLEHSLKFLADDQATYQTATRGELVPLGYEASTAGKQLRGSTIWRWSGWLGSLKTMLNQVTRLIREKHPQDDLHRIAYDFPARKYRSPTRRERLQDAARLLLQAFPKMRGLFQTDIFTAFAT